MRDIAGMTALAAQLLTMTESDSSPIRPPMPEYVTVLDSGQIGFLMRSFAEVKEWAEYLETEYAYHTDTKPEETNPHGYGKTIYENAHYFGNVQEKYVLSVYYNAKLDS